MYNEEIRKRMKRHGIYQWQLGKKLGVAEMTITRWFRTELPEEKKEAIKSAIAELVIERDGEDND